MKRQLAAVALLLLAFCGCNSEPSSSVDLLPFKISDLDSLPVGLAVVHSPNPVYAHDDGRNGHPFTWIFQTIVSSTGSPVTIQAFGAQNEVNGKWVLGNSTKEFFTTSDFEEWYSCPGGVVETGKGYVNPANWGGSKYLVSNRAKWFFVGIDEKGNRVKGEAIVEQVAETIK